MISRIEVLGFPQPAEVANGTAQPEYQDAEKFFTRTFITEGMRLLLISVAQRLAGQGGDPLNSDSNTSPEPSTATSASFRL